MNAKQFHFAPSFVLVVVVPFVVFSILTNMATAQNNNISISDRLALLEIKFMIKDDPQGVMASWNDSNTNFCQWEGVTCGRRHQRVTLLDLSSRGLSGMLSPAIGNLSFLREISLFNNSLSGKIPPEIGRLFRLQVLALHNNSFTGNIPATVTNCSNLQVLHLAYNNLVGKIPDGIGSLSMLSFLTFYGNILEGGIPSFIANLTLLENLSLGNCQLGGSFPDVFHRLTNLRGLEMPGNNLIGTQIQSFDESSFFGNKLCGAPLTNVCIHVNVSDTIRDHKEDDGSHKVDWGLIICIVFGFIIGFWVIVVSLMVNRSWRGSHISVS